MEQRWRCGVRAALYSLLCSSFVMGLFLLAAAFTPTEPYSIWEKWDSTPEKTLRVVVHVLKGFFAVFVLAYPFAWLKARSDVYWRPLQLFPKTNGQDRGVE